MTALVLATLLSATDPGKPVITVLYFDYQGTDAELAPFRKGFADMVITDLVSWDGVAVVEREKMDAVLGELKLQQSKFFDKATAVKIGKFVGAQYAVTGTMSVSGGELRVDSRIIKAESGQDVVTASVRGPKDKVFDLEQELVDKLTAGIDIKLKANTNTAGRKKVKVPDYATVLAYGQALDLADQGKREEAQKAFQQVVSKAPSFLLGREKREAYAKRLVEYEQRKQDITTESAAEMLKRTEAVLTTDFSKLDQAGQLRFLTMRLLKARFIGRALKAHLSAHDTHPLVVLKGHESPALEMMRGWVANHRQLQAELATYVKVNTKVEHGYPQAPPMAGGLVDEEIKMVADAKLGKLELHDERLHYEILGFVLQGEIYEGEKNYTVGPALGDLDAAEQKTTFAILDARIKDALDRAAKEPAANRRSESEARNLLEEKARALERLEKDEDAIATLQQMLDAFPTNSSNSNIERHIKELLGAEHSSHQNDRERWAKALKDCEDMDMRVGVRTVDSKVHRMGLAGLTAQANELEKACKPAPKTRSGLAYVYETLAGDAARYDDCEGAKLFWQKYVENNGSIGDMRGWAKHTPWCQIGELEKKVQWMYSALDENWTREFTRALWAIPSNDGKVISLHGSNEGKFGDDLSLRLEPKGGGWACSEARWQRHDEKETLVGTCDVKLSKLAEGKGDYYEGTYAATFFIQEDWGKRKMTMTNGTFRLRREN